MKLNRLYLLCITFLITGSYSHLVSVGPAPTVQEESATFSQTFGKIINLRTVQNNSGSTLILSWRPYSESGTPAESKKLLTIAPHTTIQNSNVQLPLGRFETGPENWQDLTLMQQNDPQVLLRMLAYPHERYQGIIEVRDAADPSYNLMTLEILRYSNQIDAETIIVDSFFNLQALPGTAQEELLDQAEQQFELIGTQKERCNVSLILDAPNFQQSHVHAACQTYVPVPGN